MSLFDYQATQADGTATSGRIEASSSDEARRLLTAEGLTVGAVTLVAGSVDRPDRGQLSAAESEQFVSQVAQFSGSGLPLEAGLRAAAAEVDKPRIKAALLDLADQLKQGIALETAIAQPTCQLPPHLSGLVAVAARTGRLGTALAELLDHQYEARSLRGDILRGFAYPLFVVGVACLVIFVILFGISGVFQQMFDEFELNLPLATELLFWWRDTGFWILMTCIVVGAIGALILRALIGEVAWLRLISTMPIVGRMSFWSGMAEWTGLMSVLIHYDVPLPKALKLSAGGIRNAYVGNIVDALALDTEHGKSFSDAITENRHVPASLVPVIRWGEQTGALPEALATTRELLARRVRIRAMLLRSVLPPFLFILIVTQVGAIIVALFMPLLSLIQGLS